MAKHCSSMGKVEEKPVKESEKLQKGAIDELELIIKFFTLPSPKCIQFMRQWQSLDNKFLIIIRT